MIRLRRTKTVPFNKLRCNSVLPPSTRSTQYHYCLDYTVIGNNKIGLEIVPVMANSNKLSFWHKK